MASAQRVCFACGMQPATYVEVEGGRGGVGGRVSGSLKLGRGFTQAPGRGIHRVTKARHTTTLADALERRASFGLTSSLTSLVTALLVTRSQGPITSSSSGTV